MSRTVHSIFSSNIITFFGIFSPKTDIYIAGKLNGTNHYKVLPNIFLNNVTLNLN